MSYDVRLTCVLHLVPQLPARKRGHQFAPLTIEKQVLVIFAGTNGYLDDIAVTEVERFQKDLLNFAEAHAGSLLQKIATKKAIDDEIRNEIKKLLIDFKEQFAAGAAAARA